MGQIYNRLRRRNTVVGETTELHLFDSEKGLIDGLEIPQNVIHLKLKCRAHNGDAVSICVTPLCDEDPVVCGTPGCGVVHVHEHSKFL
jgi:hypothetical protein